MIRTPGMSVYYERVGGGAVTLSWGVCVWGWRLLWLNPLLWPTLLGVHLAFWFCGKLWGKGKAAASKYTSRGGNLDALLTDGKLATEGSAALFVLLAGVILQAGEALGGWLAWWRGGGGGALRRGYFDDRRAKAAREERDEDCFHTPPSSPPPFDLVSPLHGGEEGEDADAGGAYSGGAGEGGGAGGVAAPTLRERLRNAASAMNMMRRLGVGVLYPIHDPANAGATNSSQQADLRLGINRSMRAYNLFEEIKKDYQDCYARFPSESAAAECPERDAELQRVHERSARKCLELARTNGGLYTKAAQFVASLQGGAGDKGIPKAYVDVLRVLTDAAPYHDFDEMDQVLVEEFGQGADELFASFDKVPIAAASLAQVPCRVLACRAIHTHGAHIHVERGQRALTLRHRCIGASSRTACRLRSRSCTPP